MRVGIDAAGGIGNADQIENLDDPAAARVAIDAARGA